MGDIVNNRPGGTQQDTRQDDRADFDSSKGSQLGPPQPNPQQANFTYQYQQQQHMQGRQQDSFSMSALSSAMPTYPDYNHLTGQRYPTNASPSAIPFQMQNPQQYGSTPAQSGTNSPYTLAYNPQFQGQYAPPHTPSPQGLHSGGQYYNHPGFIGQAQSQGQQFYLQQNQYSPQGPIYGNIPGTGQFLGRGGFAVDLRAQAQQRINDYPGGSYGYGAQVRPNSVASSASRSSVVRGPPRKPRQSGHAIWIGNLPPQTDLMSLVLHVCKETSGLESLFLISKSNCAFANFKNDETCGAAQAKIHDSRFQNVRLVSRLRRSSVGAAPGVTVPTGPAALSPQPQSTARTPSPQDETQAKETSVVADGAEPVEDSVTEKEKFFVVKSLTVEDLELSVRNGIWATQSHNEEALNKAYQSAENVYLIFSANKSGEYFGYARMTSPINDDPAAAIEFAPKAQTVEDPELPKAIATPATEFAPKGRIIDDSARGTIFWEVERDESEDVDGAEEEDVSSSNRSEADDTSSPSKAWGKPFQVEWLSTTRLPFYRTRGLRNPWNSNREVKIARDGTELETAIGRRLLGLFHRLPSPVGPQHLPGMPIGMLPGYPQMRPYV